MDDFESAKVTSVKRINFIVQGVLPKYPKLSRNDLVHWVTHSVPPYTSTASKSDSSPNYSEFYNDII